MNSHYPAAFFTVIKSIDAHLLLVLPLALVILGCAIETQPIDIMRRDSNTVSHGIITTNESPRTTGITIDIDRRIYMGTLGQTAPNKTFGLALAYGKNNRAAESGGALSRNEYYMAILSSTDNHVLRCDFTGAESKLLDGY